MEQKANGVPKLPCPNCGKNILVEGFYNSCTETQSLREDNYGSVVNDRLWVDHSEDDHDTINHECDSDAYCTGCDKLLPWTLFAIRDLDGMAPTEAEKAIAELMQEAQSPDAT